MFINVRVRKACLLQFFLTTVLAAGSYLANASTPPPPFVIYDNSFYPNSASVFGSAGALRTTVMYSQSTWPGTCNDTGCPSAPTETEFKQDVTAYVNKFGSSNVIIFDYENLVISNESSTAAANNAVALFQQMITWARQVYPNAKIGMYDYDYSSKYAPNSASGYNSIRAKLYNGTSASFDFFAPTMYQRWSTHAAWDQNLAQAVVNDSAINQANGLNLPINAYISPYVSGGSTTLLADSEWQSELTDLVSCSNPVSSACQTVLANYSAPSGSCSASGSTYSCSRVGGGILWVGGSSNVSPATSWVLDLFGILSPQLNANVTYEVLSTGLGETCLDGAPSNSEAVVSNTCAQTSSQLWKFSPSSNGTFTINNYAAQQAVGNGSNEIWDSTTGVLHLSALSSGQAPAAAQQWQVVSLGNGYYEFVEIGDYATVGNTDSEECLTAGTGGLTTSVCNGGLAQEFQISFAAASGYTTLSDTADAFIQGGTSAGTNYGTWSYNIVEGASDAYGRKTYLKFDLSGISETITHATLYLVPTIVVGIDTDAVYVVSDNTWMQTGITWNNAPALSSTALATWSVSSLNVGLPMLVDVSSAAISAQSSGGLLSLGIQAPGSSNYVGYGSQRNGTSGFRPLLVVSTQ